MVRKHFRIEERQERALKELAAKTGRSEADLIREAIERIILSGPEPRRDSKAWEEAVRFMEERIKRLGDVPQQKRTWTREDAHGRPGLRKWSSGPQDSEALRSGDEPK